MSLKVPKAIKLHSQQNEEIASLCSQFRQMHFNRLIYINIQQNEFTPNLFDKKCEKKN